ncbi:MAG: TnpV protein [Ruminococcus sp.]|nr:TnpV protein [Ruminococcus sp.]
MKEHIKSNGISYTLQGDYYLPDLKMPEQPKVEIGIWGQRHLRYIKKYRPILYTNLLTSCKLTAYLADIDDQAQSMYERLMDEMAKREGVTEQLKANDMMAWAGQMNNIQSSARETVNDIIIYI